MPEIKGYTAPIEPLSPSGRGASSFMELGHLARTFGEESRRNIDTAGRQIDSGLSTLGKGVKEYETDAENAKSQEEVSNLNAASTNLMSQQLTDYQGQLKNGGVKDPDALRATYNQQWDDLGKDVTTKRGRAHLETQKNQWDRHLMTTMAADQVTLAGDTIKRDYETLVNTTGQLIQKDYSPSGITFALQNLRTGINEMTNGARLDAKGLAHMDGMQAQAETQLVKYGAMQFIGRAADPNKAFEEVTKEGSVYSKYIPPGEREALQKFAQTQVKSREQDLAHQNTILRQKQKTQADAATEDYLKDALSDNPTKSARDIWLDPAYEGRPDLRRQASNELTMLQKQQAGDFKVNPKVSATNYLEFDRRMNLPDGDPQKVTSREDIVQGYIDGKLSTGDKNKLLAGLNQTQTKDGQWMAQTRTQFFQGVKPGFTMKPGMDQNFAMYQHDVQDAMQSAYAKGGRSEVEKLFNFRDPNYVGRPDIVNRYRKPMSDLLNSPPEPIRQNTAPTGQPSADNPMQGSFGKFDDPMIDTAARAIRKNEGGAFVGKYTLVGPATRDGDHAYGAYQVMGKNIPAWTKQWVGHQMTVQEFMHDPGAQDKVFAGQFGAYIAKHGPAGASRAWFAGEGGMNNMAANDRHWTVADYEKNFKANMVIDIPAHWTPADLEGKNWEPGTPFRLSDGRTGVIPPRPQVPRS